MHRIIFLYLHELLETRWYVWYKFYISVQYCMSAAGVDKFNWNKFFRLQSVGDKFFGPISNSHCLQISTEFYWNPQTFICFFLTSLQRCRFLRYYLYFRGNAYPCPFPSHRWCCSEKHGTPNNVIQSVSLSVDASVVQHQAIEYSSIGHVDLANDGLSNDVKSIRAVRNGRTNQLYPCWGECKIHNFLCFLRRVIRFPGTVECIRLFRNSSHIYSFQRLRTKVAWSVGRSRRGRQRTSAWCMFHPFSLNPGTRRVTVSDRPS